MNSNSLESDEAWEPWRTQWALREDTIYLNHGSFGPPPIPVREAQREWKDRLDCQPMDFFVRQLGPAAQIARRRLAAFVGAPEHSLVFVENATYGMNVVANSLSLRAGEEVVLTDHEYGAVERIWSRRCAQSGAVCRTEQLPLPFESSEQVVDALFRSASERTRLIVVSHITSPTAVILPVQAICQEARRRGIPVCIDGPHAIAQIGFSLEEIGCAFYVASCHKWLSAPFGSGFLYVASEFQPSISTPLLSWGVLPPDVPQRWDEEFSWLGTRDPTAYLTIPAAIDFLGSVGLDRFRQRTHWLARYARQRISEISGEQPITPDDPAWYGSMAHVPLPRGDSIDLKQKLWARHGIEVPVVEWKGRRWIRVSCHLYNQARDIDVLAQALRQEL